MGISYPPLVLVWSKDKAYSRVWLTHVHVLATQLKHLMRQQMLAMPASLQGAVTSPELYIRL